MSVNKAKALSELNKRENKQSGKSNSPLKWRVWLGVIAILAISFLQMDWIWSILFIVWVIPDIRNRVTYFMEPVYRDEDPILYWFIICSWIGLSLLSLLTLIWPT